MGRAADEKLESAWDQLEEGDLEGAWETAETLLRADPRSAEALRLGSTVRWEMGDLDEALDLSRRAVEAAPADPLPRLTLGSLLYEMCDFEAALEQVTRALEVDDRDPFAHHLKGLVLDLMGRHVEADRSFREASRRDPDDFPPPLVIDEEEFSRAVEQASSSLPPEFRVRIEGVPILVRDVPSREVLATLDPPAPDLLGLFVGVPLTEKSSQDLPGPPDAIYLFKRNLERACDDEDDLIEQIGVTLLHEVGHYLGMDEDDLEEAGYA